jgi:hypothetical protein
MDSVQTMPQVVVADDLVVVECVHLWRGSRRRRRRKKKKKKKKKKKVVSSLKECAFLL